ncbi:MAG: gamma-glutamylcyclotransferase [Pirellulaceae bacterium]
MEHVFVYGTLKAGQIRERNWPIAPLQICKAWTLGRLYDTGAYPALIDGEDRVAGQLWSFEDSKISQTLQVLDQIEGTNQPGQANDYDRVRRPVWLIDTGEAIEAQFYLFALLELLPRLDYLSPKLKVGDGHYSIWPSDAEWDF